MGAGRPVLVAVTPGQPEGVLQTAALWADRAGTSLVCVHCDVMSFAGSDGAAVVPLDPDAALTNIEDLERRLSEQIARTLVDSEVDRSLEVLAGDPATALAEAAARVDADLIVVGARGGSLGARLEELIAGSVAVHLVRHQSRPVLVVPRPEQRGRERG